MGGRIMAWYHSNSCDCPTGDCNCCDIQTKYAIFYDIDTNELYEMKGHFKYRRIGQIVAPWYPHENVIFLSNEEE